MNCAGFEPKDFLILFLVGYVGERPLWPIKALTKEESDRPGGDGGGLSLLPLDLKRGQVVGFVKERRQDVP